MDIKVEIKEEGDGASRVFFVIDGIRYHRCAHCLNGYTLEDTMSLVGGYSSYHKDCWENPLGKGEVRSYESTLIGRRVGLKIISNSGELFEGVVSAVDGRVLLIKVEGSEILYERRIWEIDILQD